MDSGSSSGFNDHPLGGKKKKKTHHFLCLFTSMLKTRVMLAPNAEQQSCGLRLP